MAERSPARFVGAALGEAQATWGGRWRLLWALLGLGLVAAGALASEEPWVEDDPVFTLLCAVGAWVPAWLGADLCSLRFRGNPEPHREWLPHEFAARACGRLVPFLVVYSVAVGFYTARQLFADLSSPPVTGFFSPPHLKERGDFPAWWLAWSVVFVASSLPHFSWAALFSTLYRRPRRAVVCGVLLLLSGLCVVVASGAGVPAPIRLEQLLFPETLRELVLRPHFWAGVLGGGTLSRLLAPEGDRDWFLELCWAATVVFLVAAAVPAGLVWRVALRRHRRHPYTPEQTPPERRAGDLT